MTPIEKISAIQVKQKELIKALNDAAAEAFPVGSTVTFFRGNG